MQKLELLLQRQKLRKAKQVNPTKVWTKNRQEYKKQQTA